MGGQHRYLHISTGPKTSRHRERGFDVRTTTTTIDAGGNNTHLNLWESGNVIKPAFSSLKRR